jgi:hypothetical protein
MSSNALAIPINLGVKNEIPQSGTTPRLTKAKLNFAASDAILISESKAKDTPAPTAAPLIAAITGFSRL